MKKIIIGADHAGFRLKEDVKAWLTKHGWTVDDITPTFVADNDYPPIAKFIVQKLKAKSYPLPAILFCGSGYGMDIVANRHNGIRAVVARTPQDAVVSRQEDHANILILGERVTKPALARQIVEAWLKTKPSKAARHVRRVREIDA